MRTAWRACGWLIAATALLRAQEGELLRTQTVTVVSVAGRDVFLDHGRDVGLQVGMQVRMFLPGHGPLDVEIRAVSATSARAEVPPGVPSPPVGSRGEVQVQIPASGGAPTATGPTRPNAPDHPPWERREAPRTPDQPLLVPTFGQRPSDRPATLHGRWIASSQWSRDSAGDRHSEFAFSRLGLSLDGQNYLGYGERFRFAGECDDRRVMVNDRPDVIDEEARLDLASVAFGTEHWAPSGVEVGRFVSSTVPELGLLDGVEVVQRYTGGVKFGGGLAAYPRPFPNRATGEDVGAHAFFDYVADEQRSFAATVGVQKTWHNGTADRDLLLLRADARPLAKLSLWACAKLDLYTSADAIKGSGMECTEAYFSGRWDERTAGFGVTGSHFKWPELLREEYQMLPDELIADGVVDRFGGNAWWRAAPCLRLAVRADSWRDQSRSGTAWGLDGDLTDWPGARSSCYLSLFGSDGTYTTGPGARVGYRAPLGDGWWRLGMRRLAYELTGLSTGSETLIRQSAELGWSGPVGERSDLDCQIEHWFGDGESVWALAIYWQWRF